MRACYLYISNIIKAMMMAMIDPAVAAKVAPRVKFLRKIMKPMMMASVEKANNTKAFPHAVSRSSTITTMSENFSDKD